MIRVVALLLLALTVSCAPVEKGPVGIAPPAEPLVWPPPPEKARIKYLYAFGEPKDLGFRKPFFERLWHVIVGEEVERMVRPYAVAVDGPLVAVADPGIRAVHLYDMDAQRYERIAKAGETVLASPVGVAFGPDRIYVSDSYLGKVFVLDRDLDRVLTLGDLARPTGIAFDEETGRLYVADTLRDRIFVFDREGEALFSFGGPGVREGRFNRPTHLSVRGGKVYVNDTLNYRVQVFDLEGRPLFLFGSHGDASGDFAQPKGVAADGEGHIYVVDAIFSLVQIFDPQRGFLLAFGGEGDAAGRLWLPAGLCIEGDRIYVADSYNHRVQVFEFLGGD